MIGLRLFAGLCTLACLATASHAEDAVERVVRLRLAGDEAGALRALNAAPASLSGDLERLRLLVLIDPDQHRRHVRLLAQDLCRQHDTRLCLEAQAVADMADAFNLYTLSPIFAAEKRGDLPTALRFYERAFHGAPGEDGLRIRYAQVLLQTPGREAEALKLLAPLAQRTSDPYVARRARAVMKTYRFNQALTRGLRAVRHEKTLAEGVKHLSLALLLAPDDPRARTWRRMIHQALERLQPARTAPVPRPAAVRRTTSNAGEPPRKTPAAAPATELDVLTRWAQRCREEGDDPLLIYVLTEKQRLTGRTPPTTAELARLYLKAGEARKALALFDGLSREETLSADWVYPYAETLAGAGDAARALEVLKQTTVRTPLVAALAEQLAGRELIRLAKAKAARGDWHQALNDLRNAGGNAPDVVSLRAQWTLQLTDKEAALAEYRRLFGDVLYDTEARLSAARLLIDLKRPAEARQVLDALLHSPHPALGLSDARRAASIYQALGLSQAAAAVFAQAQENTSPAFNVDTALFERDRADFLEKEGDPDGALEAYRQGFVNAGLTLSMARNDEDFTRAMRSPDLDEDWVRDAMRLHASLLYQNHNVIVTTGLRRFHDEGTVGYSDTRGTVVMNEALIPWKGGTLTLRNDTVHYNMGGIVPGAWEAMTGTCFSEGCDPGRGFTKDTGSLLAASWTDGTVSWDIGSTPVGFHYVDVTGAFAFSFDAGPFSVTTEVFRRAKDASLLAYGGQRDPATGLWWGGVRRTGGSVSASWDRGGLFGFWGKTSWEQLTGRRVARNHAWQFIASPYVRLVNRPNHETSASLFSMLWRFDKDLSGYTFGQGGYYSPQQYVGFSLSLTDAGRTENWTWRASASAGRSYAKTEGRPRYPLPHLIPASQRDKMTDLDSVSRTDADWSNGFSLTGVLERRLGSHFSLGLGAGLSKAPDYDYRWGLLYLRWYQKPWLGNLPMPVPLMSPYSAR